ncbi:MAG: hypothetical protein Q7S57_06185 [bacterium]|nr:hypothetical protein [bacterium]
MFGKIALVLVVLFGFVNSTTVAQQAAPYELTGIVFYNGKPSSTGFLCGSGRTIITAAHCLYKPAEGLTSMNPTVHFAPGATMDSSGRRLVMPHGKIRVIATAFDPDYRSKYASASGGEEVWERVSRDWVVCTLERDPGLGFFDFGPLEEDENVIPSPYGTETWYCGYPTKEQGREYQASVKVKNGPGKRLWTYGEKFEDMKGLSGGPFFRYSRATSRWTAVGINLFYGNDDGIWWHVRITEDCAKNLGQHAQLATRN